MIGTVDSHGRALVDFAVCNSPDSETNSVTAWIDTAFDGHLVFPLRIIQQLQLETLAETEAVLADGTKVTLDTFLCYVGWFAERIPLQVIANDGNFHS